MCIKYIEDGRAKITGWHERKPKITAEKKENKIFGDENKIWPNPTVRIIDY